MNRDVERVAGELTAAQREFVLWLPADGSWRRTSERELGQWRQNALRGFGKSGLVDGYYQETMRHRLTTLGQSIHSYLVEQSK